jgi:hypothetical protein
MKPCAVFTSKCSQCRQCRRCIDYEYSRSAERGTILTFHFTDLKSRLYYGLRHRYVCMYMRLYGESARVCVDIIVRWHMRFCSISVHIEQLIHVTQRHIESVTHAAFRSKSTLFHGVSSHQPLCQRRHYPCRKYWLQLRALNEAGSTTPTAPGYGLPRYLPRHPL